MVKFYARSNQREEDTVVVNPRADLLTKGLVLSVTCGVLCINLQYIVGQWEVFSPYPGILIVYILAVGFTGINLLADGAVVFLVLLASMQTIKFWIKQAWYASIICNILPSIHTCITYQIPI